MSVPAGSRKPAILYIAGSAHSGSTLLDLLLSSHPEVVSVGELKMLRRGPGIRCTCGADSILCCPFWIQVGEGLARRGAAGLCETDVLGMAMDRFVRDNQALFASVSEVSGRRWIVDSSKSPKRLESLLASDAFEVLPLHLVREPAGVVYSHFRKGRSWTRAAWHYRRTNERIVAALAGREHLTVRYEDLAVDTVGVLRRIVRRMGLEVDPSQLEWAGRPRHNLGGNRMRMSESSRIAIDLEWRRGLGIVRRAAVHVMAGSRIRSS